MEEKEYRPLEEFFLNEKRKGMEYSEIRKTLASKNLDEDRIKDLIRHIDNQIIKDELLKTKNRKAFELIIAGSVVSVVGLAITIGTFLGVINMGDSFLLAYGPILGGLGMLFAGLGKYRKH
ncbi:MAG: hypothetical protein KKD31_14960 [Bacteroidetes bacterium]|nr:hypothetical protein [Bacteroidota bacterium]